jgi:hypothetical protein
MKRKDNYQNVSMLGDGKNLDDGFMYLSVIIGCVINMADWMLINNFTFNPPDMAGG